MPLVCSDNIDAINRVIFLYFFYKSIGQIRAVCLPEQIENFIDLKTIRKYLFMKQYMLYCNKVFGTWCFEILKYNEGHNDYRLLARIKNKTDPTSLYALVLITNV